MSKPRFDALRERLLGAGVAPSHVQRYVQELVDHYEDLYQAECARGGLTPEAAECAARNKLGSDDTLAESVLAHPELRSIVARYPALVFGVAPFLMWLALEMLAVLALQNVGATMYELRSQIPLDRLLRVFELYSLALVRVFPVLVSAAVFWSATRRRSSVRWPITGATLVTVAAASISVDVGDTQIGLITSLLPGFRSSVLVGYSSTNARALGESVGRASWMLALTLVPYGVWTLRRPPTA